MKGYKQWMRLSNLLLAWRDAGKADWTHDDVRGALGISGAEASKLIQSYLSAQRAKTVYDRPTLAIHRVPGKRTSRAVYRTGDRVVDVQAICRSLAADTLTKAMRNTRPDIEAVFRDNKSTRNKFSKHVEVLQLQLEAFVASLEML